MGRVPKSMKSTTEILEDRISGLPHDVLSAVLSHLTLKEAVKTSVLSRSWKDLWKSYPGCLSFDAPHLKQLVLDHELVRHYAACRYTIRVDQVLDLHQGPTIEGLCIRFDLNSYFSGFIDGWIDFAISRKTRSLVLDLKPLIYCENHKNHYSFPAWLLHSPVGLRPFAGLTSLELKHVNLTEEALHYFLSNCQVPQNLSLGSIPSLTNFRVDNSLPELKHLKLTRCDQLMNVYVCARKLTSFTHYFQKINMVLGYVPQLSVLTLGWITCLDMFKGLDNLAFNLSQLELLVLKLSVALCHYASSWDYDFPGILRRFQISQLELKLRGFIGDSVLCLTSFLHASSCLKKLVLTLTWRYPRRLPPAQLRHPAIHCEHECLEELVYNGWLGLEPEVELISHIVKGARSLERISINLRYSHNKADAIKLQTSWEKETAKTRALQLEEILVNPRTNLVVV